jgi:hypothetical protein
VHANEDDLKNRDENVLDESIQDMVQRFLLGERRLLEKEVEGEPTMGERTPTGGKFALVDWLLQEHHRGQMSPEQFEATLRDVANGDPSASSGQDQRAQAREMLDRWDAFHLLGSPVPRRDSAYASRPDPGRDEEDPKARDAG